MKCVRCGKKQILLRPFKNPWIVYHGSRGKMKWICLNCHDLILERGEEFPERDTSWKNAVAFERKEKPIQFWELVAGGILALTNRRLIIVAIRGLIGKSYHVVKTIPLENIKGITAVGRMTKTVCISDGKEEFHFHLRFPRVGNDNEVSLFRKIVFEQVVARNHELDIEGKRERVQVVVDFSFLRRYMKKSGLMISTMKCPECTAPIKPPKTGNQTNCEYCGSTIYATDIFERIKKLIE